MLMETQTVIDLGVDGRLVEVVKNRSCRVD